MTHAKPLTLALVVVVACAVAAWFLLNAGRPDRWSLYSKVLGERRHLLVRVPQGYESGTAPCPLIILLDGGDQKQFSGDRPLYSRSIGQGLPAGFRLRTDVLPDEGHAPKSSLERGLRFIFEQALTANRAARPAPSMSELGNGPWSEPRAVDRGKGDIYSVSASVLG